MTQLTIWKLYFKDESDLLNAVKNLDIKKFEDYCKNENITGYRYILGVHKSLNNGYSITDSQFNLIKAMSKYIYKFKINT